MNKISALSSFLGLALLVLPGRLSAAPLVQFPTGSAAWTVDVSSSQFTKSDGTAASPPPQTDASITKVDVTQSETYRSSVLNYRNGQSVTYWDIPGASVILTEDPSGNPFIVYKSQFYFIPFLPSDFSWLSPGVRKEKDPVSYQGKPCFHYKSLSGEAWVDSKTLLPVALDNGVDLAIYTFHPPPVIPLVLPDKYKKMVTAFRATMGVPHSNP